MIDHSNSSIGTVYFFITILILVCGTACSSREEYTPLERALHNTSKEIQTRIDHVKVVESLYQQIRPRTHVHDDKLSRKQIDNKVRDYIKNKYTPALLNNYSKLYQYMRKRKKNFADCVFPSAIDELESVLKTLCLRDNVHNVEIHFMTNAYMQGWKDVAIYRFIKTPDDYRLINVILALAQGQEAFIEGI